MAILGLMPVRSIPGPGTGVGSTGGGRASVHSPISLFGNVAALSMGVAITNAHHCKTNNGRGRKRQSVKGAEQAKV